MNQWKIKKLGDISDMCLGKMLDKEKNQGDYQPYLANINVRWGGFDLKSLSKMRFEEKEDERYGLKYGDLIICEGGEPGRSAIWKDEVPEMKIQKALHRVRMHDNYNPFFVYYRFLLAGRSGELSKHFIGSTIKHLTGIGLKQVEFEYPSLAIQNQIAAVLSSIDQKIEINNRINAELEAMAKTLYDYWFVQFDFPDENGKPYKSSGGKMLYSNELKREIPVGWELKSLSDLTSVLTGKEDANFSNPNGKYSYFTCGEEILRCNEYVFDGKAVLVAGNGNFNVKMYHGKFNAYQRTYVLIPNDEQFYALLYFAVINRIDSITKCSRGSIVKFMTKGDLADIKMSMPKSNKCSDLLVSVINNLLLSTLAYKKENQRLAALRDWLLPMLMNGQVRVESAADDLYSPEQDAGTRQP